MATITKSGDRVKKAIVGRQQCIPGQVVEPAASFVLGNTPCGRRKERYEKMLGEEKEVMSV